MDYEVLETEIETLLAANTILAAKASVMKLPDNLADYKTPVAKGLVTVVFMGEKWNDNQSIGDISQHSTVTISLSVQSRTLRGATGVYAISEEVKQTLIGFSPTDCGNISLSEQSYNQYQNDIWEHTITFSCTSLRTQTNHNDLPFADITNGEEVYYQTNTTNENIHV